MGTLEIKIRSTILFVMKLSIKPGVSQHHPFKSAVNCRRRVFKVSRVELSGVELLWTAANVGRVECFGSG